MNVVTLTGYIPIPRFDGTHWTIAQLQEAVSADGPWTTIESYALSPVDTDPRTPISRDFTTDQATLTNGWYRIIWQDAAANQSVTSPVQTSSSYLPSVQQVAYRNLSRTRDKFGNLVGTFNADTQPTDTQVYGIINTVWQEVADVIGDDIPAALNDDAANVVALRAAMQVELDFYADQVNTGRSIYPQLEKQYESARNILSKQIALMGEGETRVTESGAANAPSYSFPDAQGWMSRRW